jgi:DNA-binding PadR family transcriptional regulator
VARTRPEELSVTEWSVLALLAERPTHGFAIARAMAPEGEIGRIWSSPRPLVYRALETLGERGLVRSLGTQPGERGPNREILEASRAGQQRIAEWLDEPVAHVRDARTLLLLKLFFLDRAGRTPAGLLEVQRDRFVEYANVLQQRLSETQGFEHTLVLWRLESTKAALHFIDKSLELRWDR